MLHGAQVRRSDLYFNPNKFGKRQQHKHERRREKREIDLEAREAAEARFNRYWPFNGPW